MDQTSVWLQEKEKKQRAAFNVCGEVGKMRTVLHVIWWPLWNPSAGNPKILYI